MAKIHDECGVFGMHSRRRPRRGVRFLLSRCIALQHRGQESCGIALNDRGVISCHKDAGLVNEVMTESGAARDGPGHDGDRPRALRHDGRGTPEATPSRSWSTT